MDEASLSVPVDLVKKTVGLAIDIGGSMIKIVYRSKENLEEANNTRGECGHLQMVSFPKIQLNRAIEYIRERCALSHTEDSILPSIRSTGVGYSKLGRIISHELHTNVQNLLEMDCFANAFMYLASRLPRKEFLHPYDDAAAADPMATLMEFMKVAAGFHESKDATEVFQLAESFPDINGKLGKIVNDSDEPIADVENIYPCLLAVLGSGIIVTLIQKDRSYRTVEISNRCGRSFHGFGSLLTGCKSYEELIELAACGNQKNVDIYTDYLLDSDFENGDDNGYIQFARMVDNTFLTYSFGKAAGAQLKDFRREDLATACLNYIALDIGQTLFLIAQVHQVKRLFLAGSFVNSALLRGAITAELVRKNCFTYDPNTQPLAFDFVKVGSYLGAIGALISEVTTPQNNGVKNGSHTSKKI